MRRASDAHGLFDRSLTGALARLGFARERRAIYRISLDSQIVGLTTFPEKLWANTRWDVFPNVGVRHEGVNRLLFELSDLPEAERKLGLVRANLLTNIGYLMPERRHKTWSFPFDIDAEPVVRELVDTIETYGLPFIRTLSEPAKLRETLERNQYSLANQDRDLPALYVMEGDYAAAETQLREGLEKRGHRHDPEAEHYRSFAARLCKLIEERKKST